jgi:hypothetical protein
MSAPAVDEPRRIPTLLALSAQVVLLGGIALYAIRSDWTATPTGLLTVLGGPLILVVATAVWWRWGSRAPLVVADIWLALYGATVLLVFTMVGADLGAVDPVSLLMGLAWLVGGIVGAAAVWFARR